MAGQDRHLPAAARTVRTHQPRPAAARLRAAVPVRDQPQQTRRAASSLELEQDLDQLPLLVAVGSQNGGVCYLNLEPFGPVSLLPTELPSEPDLRGGSALVAVRPVAEQGPDAASELLAGDVLSALRRRSLGRPGRNSRRLTSRPGLPSWPWSGRGRCAAPRPLLPALGRRRQHSRPRQNGHRRRFR